METLLLLQSLQVEMPQRERAELEQKLEAHINYLINHDFRRLTQLLYTVDVDEQQLKITLLQQPEQDAAQIITRLILARQEEKRQTRQLFPNSRSADAEEPW